MTLRSLAAADIDSALAHYRTEAGQEVAFDFIDELESALNHIERHPLAGSLRFGYELDIPELRSWQLKRFPYLVFYVNDETGIDVWRVLHARRDIPAVLNLEPHPPEVI